MSLLEKLLKIQQDAEKLFLDGGYLRLRQHVLAFEGERALVDHDDVRNASPLYIKSPPLKTPVKRETRKREKNRGFLLKGVKFH